MTKNNEFCKPTQGVGMQTPRRAKSAPVQLPPVHQIVYQTIIPTKPTRLIGEKVVYNERFYKTFGTDDSNHPPLPLCGYFTIENVRVSTVPKKGLGIMIMTEGNHASRTFGLNSSYYDLYNKETHG
ncbi:MAG: hypothetical protein LBM68_02965 [Bacteroidales bacterium]|jgi:hypothetical protein|nr:hypothetical protein [Bacteroidales bacterium]